MKRAARNVDNYLSTASLKFFIINRYESDLVLAIFQIILLIIITTTNAKAAVDHEILESHKCSRMFSYFERQYRIPSNALHSISLKESAKRHSKHKIQIVWPWAVNVEGKGYYFDSKKEAVVFVKKQILAGKENIDVGCMQINLKHHAEAFNSVEQVFDPKHNIAYGAEFLRAKYDQLKSWHKAIAHYHSATPNLGIKYKQSVIKIANNMDNYKHLLRMYAGKKARFLAQNNHYNSRSAFDRRNKSDIMVRIPKAVR